MGQKHYFVVLLFLKKLKACSKDTFDITSPKIFSPELATGHKKKKKENKSVIMG